jgi:hypothetical protein
MSENQSKPAPAFLAAMALLVLLILWLLAGRQQLGLLAPTLSVAFGAFSIWVTVRIINRRERKTIATLAWIWLLSLAFCCGGLSLAYWIFTGFPVYRVQPDLNWAFRRTAEFGIANGLIGAVIVGVCASAVCHRRSMAIAVAIVGSTVYLAVIAAIIIDWMRTAS